MKHKGSQNTTPPTSENPIKLIEVGGFMWEGLGALKTGGPAIDFGRILGRLGVDIQ